MPPFFSGVVGVEDAVQCVGRDPPAGVDHVDDGFGFIAPGGEDQLTAFGSGFTGHGLNGVEHEIEDRLLDQFRIAVDDDGLGGRLPSGLHPIDLGLGREKIDEFFEYKIQIHRLAIQFQLAGITKEIIEDIAQSRGFALHEIQSIVDACVDLIADGEIFL